MVVEYLTAMNLSGAHHQHGEEDGSPGRSAGQLQDHLRVCQEHKPGTTLDHLGYVSALLQGDVAQDGECDAAGQQTGQRVHYTSDDGVSETLHVDFTYLFGSKV